MIALIFVLNMIHVIFYTEYNCAFSLFVDILTDRRRRRIYFRHYRPIKKIIQQIAGHISIYSITSLRYYSPRHKRWPGTLFRPPGQFRPQHFISYWPVWATYIYMSGHQISNNAGPIDHIRPPHIPLDFAQSSCTARHQREASRSRTCQSSKADHAILQCEHPWHPALFFVKHVA